ncbi:hypothetical protein CHCC15381_1259 [Bacillus paralicheniformis]|uniref:Uncharacterized protein n=1 Tax=Bacillus paralicheniformis TaxID=1648923 RepID=A0ABY3FPQ5_9BACI|nr:hypothetical protein CHCC15381_1259 [Bacillus paralicheniformis]
MDGCCDADPCFDHASGHAFHSARFCHGVDFQRLADAARFHQFNIDEIGASRFQHVKSIPWGKHAFVRHNRRIDGICHLFQAFEIASVNRLFDKLDRKPLILHFPNGFDSLFRRPALIGVHADPDSAPRLFADFPDPFEVCCHIVFSYFNFERTKPIFYITGRVFPHFFRVIDADSKIRLDLPPVSAQQLIQGKTAKLRQAIVDGCFYSGLCACISNNQLVDVMKYRLRHSQVAPGERRCEYRVDCPLNTVKRLTGNNGSRRRFAPACHPVFSR